MSEPAAETPPQPKRGSKKLGPLPWWGWAAVAVIVVGGVIIWRKRSASQASTAASVGAPETAVPVPVGTGLTGSQYAALSSQNAAIFEAIQDMQGDNSTPLKDRDAAQDEAAADREAEQDADQAAAVTSLPRKGGGGTGPPTRSGQPPADAFPRHERPPRKHRKAA